MTLFTWSIYLVWRFHMIVWCMRNLAMYYVCLNCGIIFLKSRTFILRPHDLWRNFDIPKKLKIGNNHTICTLCSAIENMMKPFGQLGLNKTSWYPSLCPISLKDNAVILYTIMFYCFSCIPDNSRDLLSIDLQNCTPPAIEQFPYPILSKDVRRKGGITLHIFLGAYMFLALAIACDEYFVPACEKVCDSKLQHGYICAIIFSNELKYKLVN